MDYKLTAISKKNPVSSKPLCLGARAFLVINAHRYNQGVTKDAERKEGTDYGSTTGDFFYL